MTDVSGQPRAAASRAARPRVDGGDIITLFMRFVAANFLTIATLFCLLERQFVFAAPMAVAATLAQRATVMLYRKLRAQYAEGLQQIEGGASAIEAQHAG